MALSFATLAAVPAFGGSASAADAGLHVDQVGYLPAHPKVAMVSVDAIGAEDTFTIVDDATGKAVFTGTLTPAKHDAMTEENLRQADFTKLDQPGRYRLVVGGKTSYAFAIGKDVYDEPTVENWRSFTLQRSGTKIDDPETGLKVADGHAQDRHATVYFDDALHQKGQKLDVSGGWYDAGDYGKYTTTGAQATAQLMLAYELHPDHFKRGQLRFPSGVAFEKHLPDALSEVKYELDWLQKMQRADGSTFHKVAGKSWPGFDKTPDSDTQDRFIYGSCSSATAMYGATMAIGARVYRAFDKAYADELLDKAELAWSYLQATPEPVYRQDPGQEDGSGPYDKRTDLEERLWLAAELFRTTGDPSYEDYIFENSDRAARMTSTPSFPTWNDMLALGQYAYIKAPKADASKRASVERAFLGYADATLQRVNEDGMRCALLPGEYTWASTKNALAKAGVLLLASDLARDTAKQAAYQNGALDQIHYLFGRNGLDQSFMTGVGGSFPQHPHNRIHESTGAYVPGLVVGGPNAVSGGDPDQTAYLASKHVPTAKSYLDVLTSWSTNEYAIDYDATAAFVLAWFANAQELVL